MQLSSHSLNLIKLRKRNQKPNPKQPENDKSKPLKCGYNPYTNKWKDWSKNPLKQTAILNYGMQELMITNG